MCSIERQYHPPYKEALGPSWSSNISRKPVLKHVFPSSLSSFPQFPKKQTRFSMVSVGSCAGVALGLEWKGSFSWDYRTLAQREMWKVEPEWGREVVSYTLQPLMEALSLVKPVFSWVQGRD